MHSKIHIQNSTDQKHIFGNNIFEKHKIKKMFYISLPLCQNVIHFGKFRSEIKIFGWSLSDHHNRWFSLFCSFFIIIFISSILIIQNYSKQNIYWLEGE